jgi:hypothetical protein
LNEFFRIIGRLTEGLKVSFDKVDVDLGQVLLITDDGQVPLEAVSQGTISLLGWIGVLMQRLYEVYDGEASPIEQYALVLIDEIDAHMHPYWQLRLIPLLREIFPNVQFVATTHSPLVVCNVGNGAVFRCERDVSSGLLTAGRREGLPTGLGAEGLLTSDYFGLRTQLDDETQKLLDEKVKYTVHNGPLQEKDRKALEQLNRKLDEAGLLTTFADPYYTAFLQALARRRMLPLFQKSIYTAKELDERTQLIDDIIRELDDNLGKDDAVR